MPAARICSASIFVRTTCLNGIPKPASRLLPTLYAAFPVAKSAWKVAPLALFPCRPNVNFRSSWKSYARQQTNLPLRHKHKRWVDAGPSFILLQSMAPTHQSTAVDFHNECRNPQNFGIIKTFIPHWVGAEYDILSR